MPSSNSPEPSSPEPNSHEPSSPEPKSPGPNSNAQSKPKATAQQSFQDSQIAFAAHIRHPELHEAPADLEDRRLAIYRDLFYNNIEGFLASGFPILRSILGDSLWHPMVRDFIHSHQSHSPYFLQISEEFLGYLKDERQVQALDPAFMLKLAHYEWVELALDVSTLKIPEEQPEVVSEETSEATPENHPDKTKVLDNIPLVSPTAWRFLYQFAVHRIGPQFQPQEAGPNPTALIVYRNRDLQVHFMESNPLTLRLLDILDTQQHSGREAIVKLAEEISHPQPESLVDFGSDILVELYKKDIISGFDQV